MQVVLKEYLSRRNFTHLNQFQMGTISLLALARREELLNGKTAIVIGTGISRNPETAEFVRDFVSICSEALVIDADGINAFEGRPEEMRKDQGDSSPRVITPHPGEMATLTGIPVDVVQLERVEVARDAARKTGTCVVLKGQRTVVASPRGHLWINPTGNPGRTRNRRPRSATRKNNSGAGCSATGRRRRRGRGWQGRA